MKRIILVATVMLGLIAGVLGVTIPADEARADSPFTYMYKWWNGYNWVNLQTATAFTVKQQPIPGYGSDPRTYYRLAPSIYDNGFDGLSCRQFLNGMVRVLNSSFYGFHGHMRPDTSTTIVLG